LDARGKVGVDVDESLGESELLFSGEVSPGKFEHLELEESVDLRVGRRRRVGRMKVGYFSIC